MLQIIIIILAVAFILYTILGGADFGAGILEIFAGRRGERTVSKAIAPVWEANHVWLILAIVIIFTGFPLVYATLSLSLHIPLMVVLIGIVLRGTAFTFRYYDVSPDKTHKYFTSFFEISSFITPFFLGITLGAMILGDIPPDNAGSFSERFILPWFNLFCVAMGLFTIAIFGYIAAVFLTGEAKNTPEQRKYSRLSKIFLSSTFAMGLLVFLSAEYNNRHLLADFFGSVLCIISFSLVILLIPVIFYLVNHPKTIYLRIAIGAQVALIIFGWFAMQFPVIIFEKGGTHLTFYNTQAPYATLYQLFIALIVGLILIVPCFYFLFKVFKGSDE
ncbi:MAG: cytochrome d ubiquinol oxidase subunit II [Chitinophagaceae bacterium]|nr:cytochrome d ubiquinol oxidase subunit II [Chitinophagaceae bacterium]MBK8787344.1 cytochrome d ubiquinol oxidase subunit II [Chitinophagaceae bacterium]MBK9485849.1 cytochrome d ubiquinol oxidase subunit II [Chitinophagaceae bacterium]